MRRAKDHTPREIVDKIKYQIARVQYDQANDPSPYNAGRLDALNKLLESIGESPR